MFDYLQISDRRERALVGVADIGLAFAGPAVRIARRAPSIPPQRVLLLRLERIGDLLMALDAIDDVVRALPAAEIDLVVGSWNAALAQRIRGIRHVDVLDAAWLAREGTGVPLPAMIRRARRWRARRYDLAVNFEPDIRSNVLIAAARAARTAGFESGGGAALLDVALRYDPEQHTAVNAARLISAVLSAPPRTMAARLELSSEDRARGSERLAGRPRPIIGMHVSGGRAIKQWDPQRFAELAGRLARVRRGTILLTGAEGDRLLVDPVARAVPGASLLDMVGGIDLPGLAALLEQVDVFVTGDTGPMHLAAAVGTPVVAVFGPSNPARYAPRDPVHRIVRIDLPCSPCNRIRLPPERCAGHIPDCLTGIDVEMVYRAVEAVLDRATGVTARVGSGRG